MATIFECNVCDYKTSKKYNYEVHKTTRKHKLSVERQQFATQNKEQLLCEECGKVYKDRSGLWRHKKRCLPATFQADTLGNTNNVHDEATTLKRMLLEQQESHFKQLKEQQEQMNKQMLQQQEQIQEQIQEQQEQHNKQIQDLIPQLQQVTNNTNCNNKFNLNFFLNEQCKDAISIQHFIENLNIGIRELEHMGNVGYVQGMMSIFSETLGKMNIYERPLHCTDLKRDTLYIKQGDTWTKDTEDKTEMKKIVETVKCRNYGSLRLWEREHPEAFECDTQDNIDYMRISSESLGGFNSTDTIKLNKIIKHVVKEVYVK